MGWLFGKKRIPKVPLPPGRLVDSGSLHFPERMARDKIIEPEEFNEAAGVEEPFPQPMPKKMKTAIPARQPTPEMPFPETPADNYFYIKVEVYRKILGELNYLKSKVFELNRINKHLESSEFNEEHNFDKLKKSIKNVHDRLLQTDKRLFKR